MLGIKALNLLNARSGILGEIENVDLAMRENDPHADRGVTQTIDAAFCLRGRIMLEPGFIHQLIELALEDPRRRRPVRVVGQEEIVFATGLPLRTVTSSRLGSFSTVMSLCLSA